MLNFVNATLNACREADLYHASRTRSSIFNHMMSEVGELGIEVNIVEGQSYKQPGPDGIVGEAVDIILSALDFIYVDNKTIDAEDLYAGDWGCVIHLPQSDRNSNFHRVVLYAGKMADGIPAQRFDYRSGLQANNSAKDVIAAAFKMIDYERRDITQDELLAIAQPKLDKWIASIKKHSGQ